MNSFSQTAWVCGAFAAYMDGTPPLESQKWFILFLQFKRWNLTKKSSSLHNRIILLDVIHFYCKQKSNIEYFSIYSLPHTFSPVKLKRRAGIHHLLLWTEKPALFLFDWPPQSFWRRWAQLDQWARAASLNIFIYFLKHFIILTTSVGESYF